MTFTTEEQDPKKKGIDPFVEATAEASAGATTDTEDGDVDQHDIHDHDILDGTEPDPDLAQGESD